ncbi:hypothetical protein PHLCEN_2v1713 [Hermanssonia centrifuga]|uniref:Uncharacterized protein n=1 Tax=Hermanssonia centrifuga TaxID=98765 RepID=A0A2R6RW39_9APHY|nr:hypothetical protein PHLCEN_2v1713 [Hermanssonia centrifuga]
MQLHGVKFRGKRGGFGGGTILETRFLNPIKLHKSGGNKTRIARLWMGHVARHKPS